MTLKVSVGVAPSLPSSRIGESTLSVGGLSSSLMVPGGGCCAEGYIGRFAERQNDGLVRLVQQIAFDCYGNIFDRLARLEG
ncbi:hypothetical protein N9E91_01895 [Alphaproteobacteria bacterium]|nr:hypothetical protein [Alphaproteobacteria bacterium]